MLINRGGTKGEKRGEAAGAFFTSLYFFTVIVLIIGLQAPIAGCTRTPAEAQKELSGLNVSYTPGQFLDNAKQGNDKIVRLFLQAGIDVNIKNNDGQTALMYAAYNGHKSTVELLLKSGANINVVDKFGDSALSWAAAEGHQDIVKLIKKAAISKSY